MNRIQIKNHRIGTSEINKISLSRFDDKICILNNGFELFRTTFLPSFENIILIFSLVIAPSLSSYKNIILIFSLVRLASLSCYENIKL